MCRPQDSQDECTVKNLDAFELIHVTEILISEGHIKPIDDIKLRGMQTLHAAYLDRCREVLTRLDEISDLVVMTLEKIRNEEE